MIRQSASPQHHRLYDVSVVVPTVRLDDAFNQALASLLRQTLSTTQIVVVLDGVRLVEGAIPEDDRVSLVPLPRHVGTPAALNAGVAVASAPLIARLDADDLAACDRLARQVAVFRARPELVLLGSAADVIDARGDHIGVYEVPIDDVAAVLPRRNPFVHSSVVFRRSAFDMVGGYDLRCERMQDYELWLRLARLGAVANLPERLVSYRVHDGQSSRRTPAFGPAADAVRSSRRALARDIGRNPLLQLVDDFLWTTAQLTRALRMRRPRYLAGDGICVPAVQSREGTSP
ncbi:glycosyltransferase [Curtobacterium sp. PsM8]|uniref:glycosyltransferase n=1 Tax=Curtobacterium sp. PsM8 TaxID=3030532 RepID=UPI00263B1C4D|nr:glycosyltransferase [Curtobacterium sp. PsM8]MDN4647092.1 glycosyltransferase [Curtobacterium sp. PsM8]